MQPRSDAMICAVIDMDDSDWQTQDADRVAASMLLGLGAGDVFTSRVSGAFLARRPYLAYRERGRAVRVRGEAACWHDSGAAVLLAGRLRERDEWADRLELSRTSRDAEIYAAAFARHGERTDELLDGDYAAIVWQPQERRLHIAASAISMHPLHVWRDGGRIVVASNPRQIFAAGIRAEIDEDKIADSVLVNYSDPSRGWYKGLRHIAPGSFERHSPHGHEVTRFWSAADAPPVRFKRDEDYVEAVSEELASSVAFALENAERPSIQLSGGLDSSTIAAFAMEQLGPDRPLRSYTAIPVEEHEQIGRLHQFDDESTHVRALAEMYPQLQPSFIRQERDEYGSRLGKVFGLSAWPNQNYLSWVNDLFAISYRDGCDISLNGYFGNVTFSHDGATALPTWFRQGKWWRMMKSLREMHHPRRLTHRFWRYAIKPNLPGPLQLAIARRRGSAIDPFETWVPLRRDSGLAHRALERAREQQFEHNFLPFSRRATDIEGYIAFHEADTGPVNLGILLAHGIEVRQPYGNRRFAQLCAGIPERLYLKGGDSRWLPRQVMKGRVPEMIRTERRTGNDTADWPIHFRRYRPALLEELDALERSGRFDDIFDLPRLKKTLREWDGENTPGDHSEAKIPAGLGRAVKIARFVNHVEGRNVG